MATRSPGRSRSARAPGPPCARGRRSRDRCVRTIGPSTERRHDFALAVIERRMVDDLVDQQWPVLHQAEHRSRQSPTCYAAIIGTGSAGSNRPPDETVMWPVALDQALIPCHAVRKRAMGRRLPGPGPAERNSDGRRARTDPIRRRPMLRGAHHRRGQDGASRNRPQRHRRREARACSRSLFAYFWGPIPWMIEVAAALSAAVGHWEDFGVIVADAADQCRRRLLRGEECRRRHSRRSSSSSRPMPASSATANGPIFPRANSFPATSSS